MQIIIDKVGSGELYLQIMKAICGETKGKRMADLMCHKAPYTSQLGFERRTYVDIQDRLLDSEEENENFICADAIIFLSAEEAWFDVTICSDGIEHLSNPDGDKLKSLMILKSNKQIIFTPLGEYMITNDNNPDSHRSGWYPKYFEGWASIVLPNFHPSLNTGAFFVWHCDDIQKDFERVKNELNSII